MLLYYVRHGDPIYNPDSLTPLGKRQAEAVAKRLCVFGIDEIYASSSNRAIETAKPTSEILQKEIKILDFANECYAFQDFSCNNKGWCFYQQEFRELFLKSEIMYNENWFDDQRFKNLNFKKGVERINRETDEFLLSLGYKHDREKHCYKSINSNDKRICLFAHQGFGLAFLSSLLDIPYPMFCTRFDLSHSSVTVIEFREEHGIVIPQVLTQSNDSHLFKDGLPTKYNNRILI